ncbi:SPOSA6832_01592, partial [Sporobolomyces salmonicolor]
MSFLRHRKPPPPVEDPEAQHETPETEAEVEETPPQKPPTFTGDEYEQLLQYVAVEADKIKASDAAGEEGEWVEKRVWYMPWRTKRVRTDIESKVPPEWLLTDPKKGIDDDEAEKRREKVGWNELESLHENQLLKFIGFFRGPILYVMEIAVILAAGLRDWIDFGVIIGILFLNACVGWYQEKQAGDIVAELKAGIALKARVLRNGHEKVIEARELVPGDIVSLLSLTLSSFLPSARGHLLRRSVVRDDFLPTSEEYSDPLSRRAITGESLAVEKYLGETAYYTCGVKRGNFIGVVIASAKGSFVGRTAALVQGESSLPSLGDSSRPRLNVFIRYTGGNEQGHFEQVLSGIGIALLVIVVAFIFAMIIGGFFRSVQIARPKQNNLLVYALILLIIGVPVGLPVVTTTRVALLPVRTHELTFALLRVCRTMAVGAAYLAKHQAIVQKLTAIESLAGVDILCSDKTGTLTANKLSLNEPYVAEGVSPDWFMAVAVLASSHNIKALDPIDRVIVLALKPGTKRVLTNASIPGLHRFSPFDPVSKRITAEVECDGRQYTCAKGAPNAILRLTQFSPAVVQHYREMSQAFASRGFRTLGVAVKEEGKDWELLGLISMSGKLSRSSDLTAPDDGAHDSNFARPASTRHPCGDFGLPTVFFITLDSLIRYTDAQELGVGIKMLTGDAIARETCRQLALGTNVFDSERLLAGGMTGAEIRDFLERADGFAEVFPEHKYQVVKMLQERRHLVAMTGDGVNDAPALKKADCGIAVEGASDAARTAADVVFLGEGLSTIITAIKVSRQIFHRMKAYIVYRIALCLHLEVFLVLEMIIINQTIRVDLIVFLAIFADVATIAIAYDNAQSARRPVEWQLPKVWIISTILGLLLAAGTWIVRGTMFVGTYYKGGIIQNFGSIQEVLFLEVALTESWLILITRLDFGVDAGKPTWPSWQLLGAVLGVDILATMFCLFGWLSGDGPRAGHHHGWVDIVTVCRIYAFSIGVTKLENFLSHLEKMTFVHEREGQESRFYIDRGGEPEEGEGAKHDGKGTSTPRRGPGGTPRSGTPKGHRS